MMLMIVEIILTIVAWKRGWKWRALLPSVIVLGSAFMLGLIAGATAGPDAEIPIGVQLLFDVLNIILLSILIIKARRISEEPAGQTSPVMTAAGNTDHSICPDCGISFPGGTMLSWHREAVHKADGPYR